MKEKVKQLVLSALMVAMVLTLVVLMRSDVFADDYNTYVDANGVEYRYLLDEDGNANVYWIILYLTEDVEQFTVPQKIEGHTIKDIRQISTSSTKKVNTLYIPADICLNTYYIRDIQNIYVYGKGKITFYCDYMGNFYGSSSYRPYSGGVSQWYGTSIQGDEDVVFVLEDYSFKYASKLVTIPNKIEYIGKEALWETGITKLELSNPDGTITLKDYAVGKNYRNGSYRQLTSFELTAKEVTLEKMSLAKTQGITQIYNKGGKLIFNGDPFYYNYYSPKDGEEGYSGDNSVTYIGARDGIDVNDSLEMLALTKAENINKLCESAFSNSTKLAEVTFTTNITEIPDCAFVRCKELKTLDLPDQIKTIEKEAFYNCSSLVDVTLPEQLEKIGELAFADCPNLENVKFNKLLNSIGRGAFIKTKLKSIELPEGLESIGVQAFENCSNLESVKFNDGLKTISGYAFLRCENLTELALPASLESVGTSAFTGCPKIKKISMPFINIAGKFADSTVLEEIHFISGNVESFDMSKLTVSSLKSIYIHDDVEKFSLENMDQIQTDYIVYLSRKHMEDSSPDDWKQYQYVRELKSGEDQSGRYVYKVYSTNDVGIVEYLYNSKETRIDIPQYIDGHRVSFICDNAFSKCYNVEEITIPNSVEGFEKNAFKNCTKLKKMELPTLWAYSISEGIYSTAAMTRIEIPGNVHYVFYNAISDCSNLEEIVFKEGVNSIDCNFSNCGLLKRIYIPKSVEELYGGTTSSDRTYYVYKDSYALQYMQKNGLKYVIVDADDSGNTGDAGGDNTGGNSGNTGDNSGENLSSYYNITTDGGNWDGTHYYLPSGTMVYNAFFSDGTYTYYLQADGTPMKDRLTYHPDGVHVIYFDADGHEVFSDFAHISKSIAGTDVDDMCFFNVYGYMYVDTLTYDKTGTKLYYVNPYGVLERNGWFQFSGHEFDAGLGFSGKAGGYGYANWDCSLMVNTNTYDWNGNLVYMQGDGHMAQ